VVVTPVGGLVEQVRHLDDGYVVRAPTPEAIAEGIRAFLRDPDLYEHCSRHALQQSRGELSWDAVAGQVSRAAQELMALPPRQA
jgi:glycosyltransferase involved in cell wall biosynthesis